MKKALYLIPIVVAFVTPSLVIFCLAVFVGGIPPLDALGDIAHRQFASGHNLFLVAVIGLIPFAVLIALLRVTSPRLAPRRVYGLLIGGLIGILGLMVFAHVKIWYPMYGPGHMSSTAVIGFFFIPFYCIPTMFIGAVLGWAVSFTSLFGSARKADG
jgi:hypothetical protein